MEIFVFSSTRITPSWTLTCPIPSDLEQLPAVSALQAAAAWLPCGFVALNLTEVD